MKDVTVLICSGVDGLSNFVSFSSWFNSRKFEYTNVYYYLSHPDRNVRLILTKFRLSEHKHLIEIGRNLKIPRNQRLCAICNVLEDEFHYNHLMCFASLIV
jgi:hypothetical protein